MYEEEIADCLNLMLESIKLIEFRFLKVGSSGEFVQSSEGITLLDAIAMRLQVIGESVRKIQKMDSSFLKPYYLMGVPKAGKSPVNKNELI